MKKNCWEVKKCGREPGGDKADELGVCAAAKEIKLDGVHEGDHGGRCCWVVAGTYCDGEVQGSFAKKYRSCSQCEFYLQVKLEERKNFESTGSLIKKMKEKK